MTQQDIIIRDSLGKERFCYLHPDAKLQIELGIFEGVKSKREKTVLSKKDKTGKNEKSDPVVTISGRP